MGRLCICTGTGNNGNQALHTGGNIRTGEIQEIELGVRPYEAALNVQLWKHYEDAMEIYLENPAGERIGPLYENLGPQRYRAGDTELLIYYGKPGPYFVTQEIYIDFIPTGNYVDSGVWKIILRGKDIKDGDEGRKQGDLPPGLWVRRLEHSWRNIGDGSSDRSCHYSQ